MTLNTYTRYQEAQAVLDARVSETLSGYIGDIQPVLDTEKFTEIVTSVVGNLATCELAYRLYPEDDRGIQGYRPFDNYQKAMLIANGQAKILESIAPLPLTRGDIHKWAVKDETKADPSHWIHKQLSWSRLITHASKLAVDSALGNALTEQALAAKE